MKPRMTIIGLERSGRSLPRSSRRDLMLGIYKR